MSDFATFLFGFVVVTTSALNLAFQAMPERMTHYLMVLLA